MHCNLAFDIQNAHKQRTLRFEKSIRTLFQYSFFCADLHAVAMESSGFVEVATGAINTSQADMTMSVQPFLTYAQSMLILSYVLTISIPICIFGICSNIVNILVFYKMGFSSPTNISLFCLAIADLLTLCYSIISSFGNLPAFQDADLSFSMGDVARVGAHVYYSSCAIGSWLTAVINVERSVCMVFPLTVKENIIE